MRPLNPVSEEFIERAQRVLAPKRAHNGCMKAALAKLQTALGILPHRARDLMRGKVEPKVREMDLIREMDGVWCNKARRAVQPLMERMHDKIEDIFEFVADLKARRKAKREARLSNKSIIERMYQDNRA
jgi:hypothetical protein